MRWVWQLRLNQLVGCYSSGFDADRFGPALRHWRDPYVGFSLMYVAVFSSCICCVGQQPSLDATADNDGAGRFDADMCKGCEWAFSPKITA